MIPRLLLFIVLPLTAFADEVDFARSIQPVFAQHCFGCHGPDKQEGGYRLDRRDNAIADADSGEHPLVPGNIDASKLVDRMLSADPDVRMPPEGERVSARDVELIKQWISDGAKYTEHWAYRPLVSKLPRVSNSNWCNSPIDYFVAAKLDDNSILPSPDADRPTLIRRLYYDLLGLPPTPDAVDLFISDDSPGALEKVVDELLASPRFGERWGRHWLDKARYADSDGYEKDNPRADAWYFRDWVINAINDDLPFDEFTIEQLAGDLLPDATNQQRLATAFHRQTLTNTEGGTDKEQWRVAAVMDRTETLGTVWLGLTVGCARCHNHKYDQISQDEYYQLYAFFNNGDESTFELAANDKNSKVRVVSQRTKEPRTTRVLRRGEFLEPQHEVFTSTLSTLPRYVARAEDRQRGDRLDLARWLVDGQNPLPPRVAANHIWKNLFGKGLVRTVNDFGIRGEPPTHPALLDWLATELIRHRWSRKELIRMVVLSSTYRQSSRHRDELVDADPTNRLVHRQNRYRVEAEIVRDITLATSGLLSSRVGGPSTFPPIPSSITDLTYNSSFKWETSNGEERFRRGMYTFFKRTAPHPNLTTFDCPTSNVTCVQRESSNTPLGALVLLNNTVYVEAAREFARRLIANRKDLGDELLIATALRQCVAREPYQQEISRLSELLAATKSYYAKHQQAAQALAGTPDTELAAWTAVTRVVLNLDEFITRE